MDHVDVLVLGIGNRRMGDDGAGASVIELLQEHRLPAWARAETAGGWEIPVRLDEAGRVILVDAAQMGLPPGSWRRFTPLEADLSMRPDFHSLHQAGAAEGLALAQALGLDLEKVVCYGIEPGTLQGGQGLSPAVKAALPGLADAILCELRENDA